ncbi:MAG: hypothetical protein R6U43_09755 [Candidatus Krumholzibacteriales bacterium]
MFKGKVLLFALLLVLSTSLYAGEVDDCNSTVTLVGVSNMLLNVCPAADMDQLTDKGGYIAISVKDGSDAGISGIPWTDYWMGACDPAYEIGLCCDGIVADSLTNSDGETTISGFIGGSGCVLSGGVYMAVQNKTILDETGDPGCTLGNPICLSIEVRSPDYIIDGKVDLSDFSAFVNSWALCSGDASYEECFDFISNDCVDLSDFASFSAHWQHECR